MEKNVTYRQLNLTLQKNKQVKIILMIGICISVTAAIVFIYENSCGIKHLLIINDLKSYETSMDPEFCEELIEKIDQFNSECIPYVEILDCG